MTAEPPDRRTIRLEVEMPGTPEAVWDAIATGPGISAWFVPAEVSGREGGEITLNHGPGMVETGRVTAWEPPHRFAYVAPAEGERQLAFEWLVEAQAGGTCVVRLVNSGFGAGADWDGDYEGMGSGWRMLLQNLRLHVAHFAGQPCEAITASASTAGPRAEAWPRLTGALGIDAGAGVGDRVQGDGGPQSLAGTVEWRSPEALVLRVETPAPGTALVAAEGSRPDRAFVSVWIYARDDGRHARARDDARDARDARGDGVDADAWRAWMAERFPAPAAQAPPGATG